VDVDVVVDLVVDVNADIVAVVVLHAVPSLVLPFTNTTATTSASRTTFTSTTKSHDQVQDHDAPGDQPRWDLRARERSFSSFGGGAWRFELWPRKTRRTGVPSKP
jgi:hypothetical protein